MKENSYTKQLIVNSFKNLMKEKSFDKISISDITNQSYLNRQTFYYHFQDKYELMNYIYYNEIFLPLVDGLNENSYLTKFTQMFRKMKTEQYLYTNAIKMNNEYGFVLYLYNILEELLMMIDENKNNIDIKFYTHGIIGGIIDWIKAEMKIEPEKLGKWLEEIILKFIKKF